MPAKAKGSKYSLGGNSASRELKVPSGNVCLVRRVGVQGLINVGILDSLDSLTGLVKTEHLDRTGATRPSKSEQAKKDVEFLISHKADLLEAMALVDRVVEYVVVEPKVHRPIRMIEGDPQRAWVDLAPEERDPEKLYTDDVDEEDKMFIFQYVVGGTSSLETFRQERDELLDGLEAGEVVQHDAGSPVGSGG